MFSKIKSKSLVGKLVLSLFLFCLPHQAFGLSVTTTTDGSVLANSILGNGVTISNISYIGAEFQSGTFVGGIASGIGIEDGIILTTGDARLAVGPNSLDDSELEIMSPGDSDLENLITFPTNDAAILEFDFNSAGGNLSFNYLFASEEYNEFANTTLNDVFALFLDGTNIALVPGTIPAVPVSVDNVNGGNPFGVGAVNGQFFNNNDLSDGGPFFDIEYDGFTDVFMAQFLGLTPGIHHMKIGIADASDDNLDSAVFIQAGSFSVPQTPGPGPSPDPGTNPVPEPGTVLLLGSGLIGMSLWRWKEHRKAR